MTVPGNIPKDLGELLQEIAASFSGILRDNLVGIYLWGSLTYAAFDEQCSDVDCIVVTRRDLDECEFSELDEWFKNAAKDNRWVERLDMRFVIDNEFLDKSSKCCGFYSYSGKLVRHGSDGNPLMWMNIGQSGITLCGKDARLIAPAISDQCLNDALLLELDYLRQDLRSNAGNRCHKAFVHNAYAVLTACRILYSADHRSLVSKDRAYAWAVETLPPMWLGVLQNAKENRRKKRGSTTARLEQDAMRFVDFVADQVEHKLRRAGRDSSANRTSRGRPREDVSG
jgi:predicted nucleotidyltransferase